EQILLDDGIEDSGIDVCHDWCDCRRLCFSRCQNLVDDGANGRRIGLGLGRIENRIAESAPDDTKGGNTGKGQATHWDTGLRLNIWPLVAEMHLALRPARNAASRERVNSC